MKYFNYIILPIIAIQFPITSFAQFLEEKHSHDDLVTIIEPIADSSEMRRSAAAFESRNIQPSVPQTSSFLEDDSVIDMFFQQTSIPNIQSKSVKAIGESALTTTSGNKEAKTFKDQLRKDIQNLKNKGYIEVSDTEINIVDNLKQALEFNPEMKGTDGDVNDILAFTPTDLTKLKKVGDVEVVIELPSGAQTDQGFSGIMRIVNIGDLGEIYLLEDELSVDQAFAVNPSELINSKVAGLPATFLAKRGESGQFATELHWNKGSRDFLMVAKSNLMNDKKKRKLFKRIASQLTKQVL